MSTTARASAWGTDAHTVARALTWSKEDGRTGPPIIEAVSGETGLDPALLNLWNGVYPRVYETWMLGVSHTRELWDQFTGLACKHMPVNGLLLDAGIGTAWVTRALLAASSGRTIYGADLSMHFLEHAVENLTDGQYEDRVCLWHTDLTQEWPWEESIFEGIVANAVLEYFPEWAQDVFLEEAYRTLRPESPFLVNYIRASFDAKQSVLRIMLPELVTNPLGFLKLLALIPIFALPLHRVQKAGLTHNFEDEEFRTLVVDQIGFSDARLVATGFDEEVATWLLHK